MERFFADSPQGALLRGLLTFGVLEQGEVTERFVLTSEGWKSHTFKDKLRAQNLSLLRPLWGSNRAPRWIIDLWLSVEH